jgi:hypothetical protein
MIFNFKKLLEAEISRFESFNLIKKKQTFSINKFKFQEIILLNHYMMEKFKN